MRDSGLYQVVTVNEHIKRVVTVAHQIELVALNAILLAKRVGRSAAGFGIISDELRRFSQDLRAQMQNVRQASQVAIQACSALIRHARRDELLHRAGISFSGDILQALERDMLQARRGLCQLLEEAAKLCRFGDIITRAAKIEAAYAGGYSLRLTEIAADFDNHILGVQQLLTRLERELRA